VSEWVSESVTQNELNALLLWTNSVHLTIVDCRALSHTYCNSFHTDMYMYTLNTQSTGLHRDCSYVLVWGTVEQYTDAIQYIQLAWQSPTITTARASLNESSPREGQELSRNFLTTSFSRQSPARSSPILYGPLSSVTLHLHLYIRTFTTIWALSTRAPSLPFPVGRFGCRLRRLCQSHIRVVWIRLVWELPR